MRRVSWSLVIFQSLCIATACRERQGGAQQASTFHSDTGLPVTTGVIAISDSTLQRTSLNCFRQASDSVDLYFQSLSGDSLTLDVSGVVFRLRLRHNKLSGAYAEAFGELGRAVPLHELVVDLTNETIFLEYGDRPTPITFSGRISCDSLWGRVRHTRTNASEEKVFRRGGWLPG